MALFSIIVTWMLINLWATLIFAIAIGDILSEADELLTLFLASIFTFPVLLGVLKLIRYINRRKRKRGDTNDKR